VKPLVKEAVTEFDERGFEMNKLMLGAAAVAAIALAGSAQAAVFDLSHYAAGFTGSLGTITVTDAVPNQLLIDVNLTNNTFFQVDGQAGSLNDALWFDLGGANIPLTYNFLTPSGGSYTDGGQFSGTQFSNNAFRNGGGFLSGFDYAVQVKDSINPKDYYGGVNNLTFTITGAGLSLASLTSQQETVGNVTRNVFFGADLRQCIGTAPCVTGPVGAIASVGGVPEPATWAMMLVGFGGMGALMRRQRRFARAALV
jgi:hypothetical protein